MITHKTLPQVIKERFTTTLDGDLLQKIKILAIYEKCPTNILLEEAMKDLLKKYESKKAKGKTKRNETQNSLFEDEWERMKELKDKKPFIENQQSLLP